MPQHSLEQIRASFECIWNHKQPGVAFYTMQGVFLNPELRTSCAEHFVDKIVEQKVQVDAVAGLDSRGYLVGQLIAGQLKVPFLQVAKRGKLAGPVYRSQSFNTEYSKGEQFEVRKKDIQKLKNITSTTVHDPQGDGPRVLIVDDILATGNTLDTTIELLLGAGCRVAGLCYFGEVVGVPMKQEVKSRLGQYPVISLFDFKADPKDNPNPELLVHHVGRKQIPFMKPLNKLRPDQIAIIAFPTMYSWAKTLINLAKLHVNGCCTDQFVLIPIDWYHYPDKTPNISFNEAARYLKGTSQPVLFLGDFMNMGNLFEQLSVSSVLPEYMDLNNYMHLIFPFNPFGTQERFGYVGQLAAAKTFASMVSGMHNHKCRLTMYDIHAPNSNFSFTAPVHANYDENCTTGLIQFLKTVDLKRTAFAFPDKGAHARFGLISVLNKLKIPTLEFSKDRAGDVFQTEEEKKQTSDKRYLTLTHKTNFPDGIQFASPEWDRQVHHVIVIDDLMQRGGTSFNCMLALKNTCRAKYVSAYCTHGVLPNDAALKFMPDGEYAGFHRIWLCNTNPTVTEQLEDLVDSPFRILNLGVTLFQSILSEGKTLKRFFMLQQDWFDVQRPNQSSFSLDHYRFGSMTDYHHDAICWISSTSPVKIRATEGMLDYFGMLPDRNRLVLVKAPSGVSVQPRNLQETDRGCENRHTYVYDNFFVKPDQLVCSIETGSFDVFDEDGKLVPDQVQEKSVIILQYNLVKIKRVVSGVIMPKKFLDMAAQFNYQLESGQFVVSSYEQNNDNNNTNRYHDAKDIQPDDFYLLYGPTTREQSIKEEGICMMQDLLVYHM